MATKSKAARRNENRAVVNRLTAVKTATQLGGGWRVDGHPRKGVTLRFGIH